MNKNHICQNKIHLSKQESFVRISLGSPSVFDETRPFFNTSLDQQSLFQAWIECGNKPLKILPPSHRLYRQGISCHHYAIFNRQNDKKKTKFDYRLPNGWNRLTFSKPVGVIASLSYMWIYFIHVHTCEYISYMFIIKSPDLAYSWTIGNIHNWPHNRLFS